MASAEGSAGAVRVGHVVHLSLQLLLLIQALVLEHPYLLPVLCSDFAHGGLDRLKLAHAEGLPVAAGVSLREKITAETVCCVAASTSARVLLHEGKTSRLQVLHWRRLGQDVVQRRWEQTGLVRNITVLRASTSFMLPFWSKMSANELLTPLTNLSITIVGPTAPPRGAVAGPAPSCL